MPRARPIHRRRGALLVEAAAVLPVFLLLLFGLLMGGLMVFHWQEIAWMARDAARKASVRGSEYERETGKTSISEADLKNYVLSIGTGLEPGRLTVKAEFVDGLSGATMPWDSSPKTPTGVSTDGKAVSNSVRVTITYRWLLGWTLNLTSTSEIPMSF